MMSYFTGQNLCSTFSATKIAGLSITSEIIPLCKNFKQLYNPSVSLAMRSILELLNLK